MFETTNQQEDRKRTTWFQGDAEMDGPLNPGGGNRFGSVITSSNPGRCLTMYTPYKHVNHR